MFVCFAARQYKLSESFNMIGYLIFIIIGILLKFAFNNRVIWR